MPPSEAARRCGCAGLCRLSGDPNMADMDGNMHEKIERQQLQTRLDQLQQRLAEAWWNEAPLEQIERLEQEIAAHSHRLGQVQST